MDSTWTNATFELWLCGNMSERARLELELFPSSSAPLMLLPNCFYTTASALQTVSLAGVIVRGSLALPDPYERMAKSFSSLLTSFTLVSSKTLTYNGEIAAMDFETLSTLIAATFLKVEGLKQRAFDVREATAATTIVLTMDSSSTNETLREDFCNQFGAVTTSVKVTSFAGPFVLPECFFEADATISSFSIINLIIQGNSTYPDPWERLARSLTSNPTLLLLSSSYFLTPNNETANVNWNAMTNILSAQTLTLSSLNLGMSPTLPTLPKAIVSLRLTQCGLTGTLPSSLFAAANPSLTSLTVSLEDNSMSGSMPPAFFANANLAGIDTFSLTLSGNNFYDDFPTTLFQGAFGNASSISITLSQTNFTGPISNVLTASTFSATKLTTFLFVSTYSKFSGLLPTWFNAMPLLSSFTFTCDNSLNLQGPIPGAFLAVSAYPGHKLSVSTYKSGLSGDLPSALFQLPSSPKTVFVTLSSSSLAGIPSDLFTNANFTTTETIYIDLSNNKLTGNLPASMGSFGTLSKLQTLSFNLATNPTLSGTVPNTFLPSVLASVSSTLSTSASVLAFLDDTSVSGALVLPDYNLAPRLLLTVSAVRAKLTSLTLASAGLTSSLQSLMLDNNTLLTGELTSSFFQSNPNLTMLSASNTKLSGTMPDMGVLKPTTLSTLDLSSTSIEFCSSGRSVWASSVLSNCHLDSSTAYLCPTTYPNCSVSAPSAPSTPVGCTASTRPSSDWICVEGSWTYVGSASSTVIVIPSGASTTVIKGNLTSTTVIINGLNSVLIVDGCASNVTLLIELTPAQLETIGGDQKLQTLLSFSNDSSCASSTNVTLEASVKGSTCKKVSVSKVSSSASSTLSGLFKIDKSGCNKWWIILVAVIAGVALLVIVFVLLVLFVRPVRECVRPYTKRDRRTLRASTSQ